MIDVKVTAVIKCADKFLLVQPKGTKTPPQRWQNIEGSLIAGESVEAAAERVTKELLGLHVPATPRFVMSTGSKNPGCLTAVLFIEFEGKPDDLSVAPSDMLQNYGWFTLPQAGAVDLRNPGSTSGTYAQLQRAAQNF